MLSLLLLLLQLLTDSNKEFNYIYAKIGFEAQKTAVISKEPELFSSEMF
jgi:hypothetical protein